MQKKGSRFVADWKDALGRRHRKVFLSEKLARRYEQRMIARSKLAVELGRRISRGIPAGRVRKREASRLVEECSKIAMIAAIGKRSQLLEALAA